MIEKFLILKSIKIKIFPLSKYYCYKFIIITKLNFGAVKYRNNEKMELNLDTSRIKALGWSANVDLDDGIDKIIDEIFNKIKHDK